MKIKLIIGVLASGVLATSAQAQKMYKVVDEDGRVSYQDTRPNEDSAKIQERHVNTNSNGLSSTAPARPPAPELDEAAAQPNSNQFDTPPAATGDALAEDGQGQPASAPREARDGRAEGDEDGYELPDLQPGDVVVLDSDDQQRSRPLRSGDPDAKEVQGQFQPPPPPERKDIVRIEEDRDIPAEEFTPVEERPAAADRGRESRDRSATGDAGQAGPKDAAEEAIAGSEIKILEESKPAGRRANSRGRRPAPGNQPEQRLSTEELAEIARSLKDE